jgi:hypothetical protein
LEDYLENSLDFSGRFGMERHAQQCIRCGKELSNAQKLTGLLSGIERVKAPADFELTVLDQIGKAKLNGRFSCLRRFLVFGFEFPSWQKLSLAASAFALLGFGWFFWAHRAAIEPVSEAPQIVINPVKRQPESSPAPVSAKPVALEAEVTNPDTSVLSSDMVSEGFLQEQDNQDADYMEYRVPGPDNLPVTIRLPKKIRMQYGQPSEEYFIRNVSH